MQHICVLTCLRVKHNARKQSEQPLLKPRNQLSLKNTLKKIGVVFLSTREVSSQECVYKCVPELWLRKTFLGTIFINTDLPEKRIRTRKVNNSFQNWRMTAQKCIIQISLQGIQTDRTEAI